MATTVHLALGDAAANLLAAAFAQGAHTDRKILRFRDIYCLGPLAELGSGTGPRSRLRYWRTLLPERDSSLAEFEEEEGRYDSVRALGRSLAPMVAWIGPHSSAYLWLARLCQVLEGGADLRLVDVSQAPFARRGGYARRALGEFMQEEIPALLDAALLTKSDQRERLAQAWRREKATPSGVRRFVAGRIEHLADDHYDALLLAQCTGKWLPAAQVVGAALAACDEFLGDVFFTWRLRLLAQAGRVESDGAPGYPPDYAVRLPR
jgi:hypothetical protein